MAAPAPSHALYHLWIESLGRRLRVRAFSGREQLSRPYSFEVVAETARVVDLHAHSLVGRAATLAISEDGRVVRRVRGVVASQQYEGHPVGADRHTLRLRLVPRLWLLRRRRNTRIFQDRDVRAIVSEVLGGGRVKHRWRLEARYATLEYCVQYRETDLEFVARLLAEHGIFYYFEHPAAPLAALEALLPADADTVEDAVGATLGGSALVAPDGAASLDEVMVLSDRAFLYPALAPEGGAADVGGVAVAEAVARDEAAARIEPAPWLRFARATASDERRDGPVKDFAYRNTARSTAVELRGYDFRNPSSKHEARASAGDRGAGSPGVTADLLADDLAVYDHHDEYDRPDVARRRARMELERHQGRVLTAQGAGLARQMTPGHRFGLEGHPVETLNQEYVITHVEHEGRTPELAAQAPAGADAPPVYRNTFRCVPADVTYRPKRQPRPLQQALESAVVVGPAGEEIYTDEFGRIKVQFHWDRAGRRDEGSSCWMRVAHAWAGPTYGHQWIPRVGHEVLVAFVEGDTDRPVVVGSAYNGAHGTPFALPGDKTRSGLRTQSSPGGVGFNELSFEDAHGAELVYLRAERDLEALVGNDHRVAVRNDERVDVAHDQRVRVGNDRHADVARDAFETVARDRTVRVAGKRLDVTTGEREVHVEGAMQERVGGRDRRSVAERSEAEYGADRVVRVRGHLTTLVGQHDAPRSGAVHVEGRARVSSTGPAEVASDTEVVLSCGKSALRVGPDRIELYAPEIVLSAYGGRIALGDERVTLQAMQEATVLSERVLLRGAAAGLELRDDAALTGARVKLGAAVDAPGRDADAPRKVTRLELLDPDGVPLANQRFRMVLDDGSEVAGLLDHRGRAQVEHAGAGRVTFPDLDDVERE